MSGSTTLKVEIIGDSKSAEKAFAAVGKSADGFGKSIGKVALVGGAALAGLAVAGAAGALKLGMTFDAAYDTIQAGTGETGAALEGLKDSFKNVVSSVPVDFDTASQAITDLNQRLGLTGQPLEDLATQFINLSRVTGTDLSTAIEKGTRVFGDWGIAAEDQAEALDHMFKVTQNTGIGFDQLGEAVVKFGAPLRQLGFSFEESTALIGKFEAEGVNTELVLGSMRIALTRMAKTGEEPIETFQRLTDEIKNAGDSGAANALALELFGAKAGPDMAAAIREGRFSIDELMKTMEASESTINGTAEATDDFGERFQILKNKALVALEPIGMAALGLANIVVDKLIPAVDKLPGIFAFIGDGIQTFIGALQGDWVSSSGINPVHDALGKVGTVIREQVIPVVMDLAAFVTGTLVPAFTDLIGFVQSLGDAFDEGGLAGVADRLLTGLGGVGEALLAWAGTMGTVLGEQIGKWGGALIDWIAPQIPPLLAKLAELELAFLGWITGTALPAIAAQLQVLGAALVAWIQPQIAPLLAKAGELLAALGAWIIGTGVPLLAAQLQAWGKAFVDWIGPAAGPLLAALGGLIEQAGNWILTVGAPLLIEKIRAWAQAFVAWVGPQIGPLLTELGKLLLAVDVWIATVALPAIIAKLSEWGQSFVAWVAPRIGPLLGELALLQAEMIAWMIGTALPAIVAQLVEWGTAFAEWVTTEAIPKLAPKLIELQASIITWMVGTALPAIIEQLVAWGRAFVDWVAKDVLPALPGALASILTSISQFIGETALSVLSMAADIGVNLIQGIISGVSSMLGALRDKLSEIPGIINDALGDIPGLSPSPYGLRVGKQLVEGLIIGMGSQQRNLALAASDVGINIAKSVGAGMDAYQASIGTMPSSPTPYPVGVAAGEDYVTGIGVGINANAPAAEDAAHGAGLNIGRGLTEGVKEGIEGPPGINDVIQDALKPGVTPGINDVVTPGGAPTAALGDVPPPYGMQLGQQPGSSGPYDSDTIGTGEMVYNPATGQWVAVLGSRNDQRSRAQRVADAAQEPGGGRHPIHVTVNVGNSRLVDEVLDAPLPGMTAGVSV